MRSLQTAFSLILVLVVAQCGSADEPLRSWTDGATRKALEDFVVHATDSNSPGYVPASHRVAVFDNDGTLWSEQPMYVQLAFAIDRVKAMAATHPEWNDRAPFRAILSGDSKAIAEIDEKGLLELVMATHAGMTTDEFAEIVRQWLATARHPVYDRPYTECVYQPMLELLDYLRDHEFQIYIVSGGGVEFMRPWAEAVYGIPAERIIGSSIKVRYEVRDGQSVLVRLPELDFIDDKLGKPVGIHRFIGRRPILAVGNSDGDYEMLEYTTQSKEAKEEGHVRRLGVILHHTDGEREQAYDRDSHFGRLNRALDDAKAKGWVVVDMKRDWKTVFASP